MTLPRTGALVDTLRLASGLTLFAFALLHFLNHALGLWSLDAMAAAQHWRLAVTRSAAGTALLGAGAGRRIWPGACGAIARLKHLAAAARALVATLDRRAGRAAADAASDPGRHRVRARRAAR